MKKNMLFLMLFVGSAILFSCSKDSPASTPNTVVVQTGTIRYTNNSSGGNRYEIFLDGASLGLLSSGYYYDKDSIPVGSHIIRALQYEGYLFTPTDITNTVTVTTGSTVNFDFP